MGTAIPMNWGIICSIRDPRQMQEFIEFGKWMVQRLEESAAKPHLHLGHRFAPAPTFALHAEPGNKADAEECYTHIGLAYPQVTYVIHITPGPGSAEYPVFAEMSKKCAMIVQRLIIIADVEALRRTSNWRRFWEICDQHGVPKVDIEFLNWFTLELENMNKKKSQTANVLSPATMMSSMNIEGIQEANALNRFAGTDLDQKLDVWNIHIFKKLLKITMSYNSEYKYKMTVTSGGNPPSTSNHQQQQRSTTTTAARLVEQGKRRARCIVSGYPSGFNKFQIASLFPDFRPLNVQHIASGESIVQFSNKSEAVQVVGKYNGLCFRNEGFTLQVRAAAQEDPAKQVDAVKARVICMRLNEAATKAK